MNQFSNIRNKLRGLTLREIAAESILRGRRSVRRSLRRAFDRPEGTGISNHELNRALGGKPVAEVAEAFRAAVHPQLTAGLADIESTAQALKQISPASVGRTTREADAILAHRIPVFDDSYDLGAAIDWHADPATGVRWPLGHSSRVGFTRAEDSDVRRVWELNRLHHLAALGQAFALTGDERYAEGLLDQFTSWCEANPPRFGVNWTVAMEAGIRAINLIAAFQMSRASKLLTNDAIRRLLKCLLSHGRFIWENLEFSHRATSNHYLSNLIGLFAIGACVPEFSESRRWMSYAGRELETEMRKQVLADGVDYEGTTNYHRLVLEIFALHFTLSHSVGIILPARHRERLEAMVDFVRHYLKPDGAAPSIGDSDDGRLLKFKRRPAADHSYLMSIGAVLFENAAFTQGVIDEEAVWWFGARGCEAFAALPSEETGLASKGFTESKIFIQRSGPLYAIIDCGDHGAGGRGSHAHSDALSIEVFAYDRTFLRDPGTYLYTGNERWRNLFRSTAYHNTVRVDGRDISLMDEGSPFALGPNVRPRVNRWESSEERDVLDAEHDGYASLAEPLVHRRIVTFEKRDGYWIVEDLFAGRGTHQFEFFFNFDPGLEVTIRGGHRVTARGERSSLEIIPATNSGLTSEIAERWVSPSFGRRVPASGIIYRFKREAPFSNVVLLVPYRMGDQSKVERVMKGSRMQEPGSSHDPLS